MNRLNPFFIRSAVGMIALKDSKIDRRLNPFFIRSAVGIALSRQALPQSVRLNPFFIRSAVGISVRSDGSGGSASLNPFFIRSAVGIDDCRREIMRTFVLIPSSSGLRLEFFQIDISHSVSCLNPFFIRSAVGMNSHEDRRQGVRLNPFFIRSAVGIKAGVRAEQNDAGLNPFFIRSAVGMLRTCEECRTGCVLIPSSSGLRLESTDVGTGGPGMAS